MRVRDIMSTSPYTIRLDKQVIAVESIMEWADVRHVPVVDVDGNLVGVLSERDLLRVAVSELDQERSAVDRRYADLGTRRLSRQQARDETARLKTARISSFRYLRNAPRNPPGKTGQFNI